MFIVAILFWEMKRIMSQFIKCLLPNPVVVVVKHMLLLHAFCSKDKTTEFYTMQTCE